MNPVFTVEELIEIITIFWYKKYGKFYKWKINNKTREEIEELAKDIERAQWEYI